MGFILTLPHPPQCPSVWRHLFITCRITMGRLLTIHLWLIVMQPKNNYDLLNQSHSKNECSECIIWCSQRIILYWKVGMGLKKIHLVTEEKKYNGKTLNGELDLAWNPHASEMLSIATSAKQGSRSLPKGLWRTKRDYAVDYTVVSIEMSWEEW